MEQTKRRGPRRPDEPETMGAKEAAATLGVNQTNLRVTAGLPEPYQEDVAATTLYRAWEIRELAAKKAQAARKKAILAAERAKREAAEPEATAA